MSKQPNQQLHHDNSNCSFSLEITRCLIAKPKLIPSVSSSFCTLHLQSRNNFQEMVECLSEIFNPPDSNPHLSKQKFQDIKSSRNQSSLKEEYSSGSFKNTKLISQNMKTVSQSLFSPDLKILNSEVEKPRKCLEKTLKGVSPKDKSVNDSKRIFPPQEKISDPSPRKIANIESYQHDNSSFESDLILKKLKLDNRQNPKLENSFQLTSLTTSEMPRERKVNLNIQ